MSKKKSAMSSRKSEVTMSSRKSEAQMSPDILMNPTDTMVVKIKSLRVVDEDTTNFVIKVTYFDQLLLSAIINSIGAKDEEQNEELATGTLNYDPSDYEKMCLYADTPLIVNIQPVNKDEERILSEQMIKSRLSMLPGAFPKYPTDSFAKDAANVSCCNIDILAMFLGDQENQTMCIKKRMEPMITPSMSHRKSWDTLPLLTLELTAERNPLNAEHHKVLKEANWMKLTVVAAYNMYIPYEDLYTYTAASKTPLYCDSQVGLVTYCQGYREPKRFNCNSFFPKWETLRLGGEMFTKGNQKMHCKLEDIQNDDDIDLPYYLNRIIPYHTAVWASFHRTLILKESARWLQKQIRNYKWPLEVHVYGETGGYSFMAFLNLFRLLYPGEHTVRLAVPLHWINGYSMMQECGCQLLLTPNDKAPSSNEKMVSPTPTTQKASKSSKFTSESVPSVSTLTTNQIKATGADDNCAFVVVEVKLGRPLKKLVIPTPIPKTELSEMLTEFENEAPYKRQCTARGQLERDWQATVRNAANSLRKVPYYGTTEFCTFNRQLSETRTRVELTTSCWQEAAIYINNNFVVQQYLHSDETFEELVMMAHACMIKSACATLIGDNDWKDVEPTLRAARHARQMQDTHHAMELYMRLIVDRPRNADYWRELSTCLKDIDRDWAIACLNKSVVLNPRNPLILLSKGAMLFEEDPAAAEPFFSAAIAFYPHWSTVWVIVSAYYYERELFHVADKIMEYARLRKAERFLEETNYMRTWENELGDWWDSTPLLPGMSPFFSAADLLLRLRAIPLAEVCVARSLSEAGESAAYYHIVALCCRLRGEYQEALCHLKLGLEKYGEINYLRSLEAECYYRLGNIASAMASYEKAGSCVGAFSILMSMPIRDDQRARAMLVDLVRRQPSAYGWTAVAEDWVKRAKAGEGRDTSKTDDLTATKACAIASAVQALKLDRRAGRAWALLASLVKPSVRRIHCLNMANICGWDVTEKDLENATLPSKHSMCHQVGTALQECQCHLWENMRM